MCSLPRNTPKSVARQLRQESGFGCAVCGRAFVEYHHIIEWRDKQHFDPEHMVALCPSCHAEYGKLPKAKAYAAKKNPINIRNGRINGYLGGNKAQKDLFLGDVRIENCARIIDYSGLNILSYNLIDGEYRLNALIPDRNFWPEIEISDNELTSPIKDFWDIEFKTNWVKFYKRKRDLFLTIDFRGDHVQVECNLELNGEIFQFFKGSTKIAGSAFSNTSLCNGMNAISIGPSGRTLRPNFAMVNPKAIFLQS